MTTAGSTVAAVTTRFADRLHARPALTDVAVNLQPPVDRYDLTGASGATEAIWVNPEMQGESSIMSFGLSAPWRESYRVTVHIVVAGRDTADDVRTLTARADELLGEVMDEARQDWRLAGTWPTGWDGKWYPVAWRRTCGVLEGGTAQWAATIDYELEVEAWIVDGIN